MQSDFFLDTQENRDPEGQGLVQGHRVVRVRGEAGIQPPGSEKRLLLVPPIAHIHKTLSPGPEGPHWPCLVWTRVRYYDLSL